MLDTLYHIDILSLSKPLKTIELYTVWVYLKYLRIVLKSKTVLALELLLF